MDIVERLRSPNFADKINMVDLHNQAADEIERLREALWKIERNEDAAYSRDLARAALKGKL